MAFFAFLGQIFLFPGTMVLSAFGISPEEDGGIFRSIINMIFWGFLGVMFSIPFIAG